MVQVAAAVAAAYAGVPYWVPGGLDFEGCGEVDADASSSHQKLVDAIREIVARSEGGPLDGSEESTGEWGWTVLASQLVALEKDVKHGETAVQSAHAVEFDEAATAQLVEKMVAGVGTWIALSLGRQ